LDVRRIFEGKYNKENNMSLIKCPDCENSVSKTAITCPNCGRPTKSHDLGVPAVAGLIMMLVGAFVYAPVPPLGGFLLTTGWLFLFGRIFVIYVLRR
jgi:hypothetical protein